MAGSEEVWHDAVNWEKVLKIKDEQLKHKDKLVMELKDRVKRRDEQIHRLNEDFILINLFCVLSVHTQDLI